MRWIAALLALLLMGLQYRLWFGEGSFAQRADLERRVQQQQETNQYLQERNSVLASEVEDLKSGLDSVEERARSDLGMIKKGETFIMVIKDDDR